MDRATKEATIKEFNDIFNNAAAGVLIDFQGTTVEEITKLRKDLYEQNSKMRVLKNRLAKIGAKDTPAEELADQFVQTRAFVYSEDDVVAPAKIVFKEAKNNDNIKVIGGMLVSGDKAQVLDLSGIEALGNLPSKEELIAKLLFLMNAPITNFARTLNEIPSSFARVIQAIADSKE